MTTRKPLLVDVDPDDPEPAGSPEPKRTFLPFLLLLIAAAAGAGYLALRDESGGTAETLVRPARTVVDSLRADEAVADVIERQGMAAGPLIEEIAAAGVDPNRVPDGTVFVFRSEEGDTIPTGIRFHVDDDHALEIRLEGHDWRSRTDAVGWSSETVVVSGQFDEGGIPVLDSASLARVAPAARFELITRLAAVLAWQIDVRRPLQPEHFFRAVTAVQRSSDGLQRVAGIRAVYLDLGQTRRIVAFRFSASTDAPFAYFDDRGRPLGRAFLRAPLASGGRTSSTFTTERVHPVLGTIRAHRGVDYPAPAGTPVVAAADGFVRFAGTGKDLGNFIELDHGRGVTTRYGHLSQFHPEIAAGRRVRAGQIIGYVGDTGLATAPHLHYELRVGNRPIDMRLLDVDPARPVDPLFRDSFDAERARLSQLLFPEAARSDGGAGQ